MRTIAVILYYLWLQLCISVAMYQVVTYEMYSFDWSKAIFIIVFFPVSTFFHLRFWVNGDYNLT